MKLRDDLNTPEIRKALEGLVHMYGEGFSAGHTISSVVCAIRAPEPCQPPIPWRYLDGELAWMAMDKDGGWFAFSAKPRRATTNNVWGVKRIGDACLRLPCPNGCPTHDWKDTLIQRPEGE